LGSNRNYAEPLPRRRQKSVQLTLQLARASAYASRGLVWAALAGEMLASLIEGEPLPLERDLANALDPGRFVLKQARHGSL
jgi:hypothetical protein